MGRLTPLTEKEKASIRPQQALQEPISQEMYILAKSIYLGGYGLFNDIMTDRISLDDATELLRALDMVWHEYENIRAISGVLGNGDDKTFKNMQNYYSNKIKVE